MHINTERLKKGAPLHECRNLEQRLADALSNLRTHVNTKDDENSYSPGRVANHTDGLSSDRSSSLHRTRELHKRLLASHAREAELQDEVDSLKSTIQEQDSRMSELDEQIKELQKRYASEQHRFRLSRSELMGKMGDMKAELTDDGSKYRNMIQAKDMELEALKLKLSNFEEVAEAKSLSPIVSHEPKCMHRMRPHSSLSVLPSVSEYFKTAVSPSRQREIQLPRLFRW